MIAIKSITIDLWKPSKQPITINQYEAEGRTLVINLTAGGLPVNLTGADVAFYAKKPDGNIVFNDCTVEDAATGQISYLITGQTCILAGTLECFIMITKSGPNVLRTQKFDITVQAGDDVSSAVESASEFTDLETALATIAGFIPAYSIEQDENGLHLVGDEAEPAKASAYGWDGENKGFLPFQKSVVFANDGIELDGDEETPDNGKFYGVLGGVKGFHELLSGWIPLFGEVTFNSVDNPTGIINVPEGHGIGPRNRLKFDNGGYTIYGIVQLVTSTTVLFTHEINPGTNQALHLMADSPITNVYFSRQDSPLGFPVEKDKWTLITASDTRRDQSTPSASTWYNMSEYLDIAIGEWDVDYKVLCHIDDASSSATAGRIFHTTLSIANNAETDKRFTEYSGQNTTGPISIYDTLISSNPVSVASKTRYYLLARTGTASFAVMSFRGDTGTTIIRAVCAYL